MKWKKRGMEDPIRDDERNDRGGREEERNNRKDKFEDGRGAEEIKDVKIGSDGGNEREDIKDRAPQIHRSNAVLTPNRLRTISNTEARHSPRDDTLIREAHLQTRMSSSTGDRADTHLQPGKLSSTPMRERTTSCSSTASTSGLSKSAVNLVDEAEKHHERVPLNTPWTFWLDK